jgi:hypothetical protein
VEEKSMTNYGEGTDLSARLILSHTERLGKPDFLEVAGGRSKKPSPGGKNPRFR